MVSRLISILNLTTEHNLDVAIDRERSYSSIITMGRHGDIVVPRREEKEDVPLLIDAMEHVHNLVTASLPIKMSSTTTTNVHQMNRTEIIVQDRTISSNLSDIPHPIDLMSNWYDAMLPLKDSFDTSSSSSSSSLSSIVTGHDHHHHHLHGSTSSIWLTTHLADSDIPYWSELNQTIVCLLSIALLFNLFLCISMFMRYSNRTRTHLMMENVFVSNLLMIILSLPFEVAHHFTGQTNLPYIGSIGQLLCRIVPSLQLIVEFVTAASITILAVDKCQSIGVKHNYRITNVFSVGLLSKLIWLIAILLSIPNMMYGETSSLVSDSGRWSTTMCRVDLSPLVTSSRSPIATIVHPCVLLLYVSILYVGPLMIIIVSHCKTYLYIFHNSHHHSHAHDLQKRIRTSDREAVRMLSVVATTFTITWLPLHVVQVVSQMAGMLIDSNMTDQQTRFWSMCYMVTRLIALLSLCLTPILFVTFNRSAGEQLIEHLYTIVGLVQPTTSNYHRRTFGQTNSCTSSSSSSSSSSTSSSSSSSTSSEQDNCSNNSLQKLLQNGVNETRETNCLV